MKKECKGCNSVNSPVTEINDPGGRYTTTFCEIFSGITLIYNDAHLQSCNFDERVSMSDHIIDINHCREGRVEYNINGEYCYLSAGDISITRPNEVSPLSYFPLGHYHGITVRMDLEKTPKCLSCLLDDVNVSPKAIAEKFCSGRGGYIARANPSFEHIFSELYSVPEDIKKGFCKIKTLELLLFLSATDLSQDEMNERKHSRAQVELAKDVSRYLMENRQERVTIEQLSEIFHVSGTHLKNTFKGVYGVPLGSYIRARKMESAAYMLEYTDMTITQIAGEHGYDNASKFAGAFRAVKGVAPNEYRNMFAK